MGIFHYYVSLPEGNKFENPPGFMVTFCVVNYIWLTSSHEFEVLRGSMQDI